MVSAPACALGWVILHNEKAAGYCSPYSEHVRSEHLFLFMLLSEYPCVSVSSLVFSMDNFQNLK